ncbi:hypothetical protein [Nostocoides sp. Soil756]|jgi:hypothetical protein|uniref:hypothetical protein n=1 Tax=Nostocoides sp. Soil756 TaxID=1736399 RepID=UPI000A5A41B2|nr:hypothetical protein [Tetrasphaera sp. Soil756]
MHHLGLLVALAETARRVTDHEQPRSTRNARAIRSTRDACDCHPGRPLATALPRRCAQP